MKYIITIYNRITDCTSFLEATEETLNTKVQKELGGWDNLHSASTSGYNRHSNEYMQAGTTRDDIFIFSILSINTNLDSLTSLS